MFEGLCKGFVWQLPFGRGSTSFGIDSSVAQFRQAASGQGWQQAEAEGAERSPRRPARQQWQRPDGRDMARRKQPLPPQLDSPAVEGPANGPQEDEHSEC
eukprot:15030253-Alexandrium_andersonii.AAC.1